MNQMLIDMTHMTPPYWNYSGIMSLKVLCNFLGVLKDTLQPPVFLLTTWLQRQAHEWYIHLLVEGALIFVESKTGYVN